MIKYITLYYPTKKVYVSGKKGREYEPVTEESIARLLRVIESGEFVVRRHDTGIEAWREWYWKYLEKMGYA